MLYLTFYLVKCYGMQAEVSYLGELQHPNLVKLVGYCNEDEQRMLVYEFMPRGSLEKHLFRSMSFNLLFKETFVLINTSLLSSN